MALAGPVAVVHRARRRRSQDVVFSSTAARQRRSPMHENGRRSTAKLVLETLMVAAVVVHAPELLVVHCLITSTSLEARVMVVTRVITNQSRRRVAALTQVGDLRKQPANEPPWPKATAGLVPCPGALSTTKLPAQLPNPRATGIIRRRAPPSSKNNDEIVRSERPDLGTSDRDKTTGASTAWNTWKRWVIVVLAVVLLLAVLQPPEEAGLTGRLI